MPDRLQEIRARLDAAGKEALRAEARVSRSGPVGTATITYGITDDALREFSTHAPADIAWLLDELNRVWDYVYHRNSCAVVDSPANKCDCGLAELESGKP